MSSSRVLCRRRTEVLILAFILVCGFLAFPAWFASIVVHLRGRPPNSAEYETLYFLAHLAYGLLLALSAPRLSGLRVGDIAHAWRGVLLVCGGPVAVTALVYPFLPTKPWGGVSFHMWLTSPLAQDAVFLGYLYGRFERLFPGRVWQKLPITGALVLTALYFAAWHIPNFIGLPAGYVTFQLLYTFVGCVIIGLARVWTGSIFYGVLAHMGINLIAWVLSPAA